MKNTKSLDSLFQNSPDQKILYVQNSEFCSLLKFCDKCNSILIRKNNYKCFSCDGDFTVKDENPKKPANLDLLSSFPFKKGEYYQGKLIREKCHAHPQWGISQNPYDSYWIVIKTKKSKSNIYDDKMVSEGLYSYVGQGLTGDQVMNSSNYGLKNAKVKGQKIHLFWQSAMGSDHKYLGEVEVEKMEEMEQPDQYNIPRNVFVFFLRLT